MTVRLRRTRYDARLPWTIASDRRTKANRFLREVRAGLLAHLGHEPSYVEAVLVERAAQLQLHLAMLDFRWSTGSDYMPEHVLTQYIRLDMALRRHLIRLGLQSEAPRKPTLAELLRREAAPAPNGRAR